jgi:predicted negative regulator of RcsB-dependent stress response
MSNASRLIASLHIAEEAFDAALAAKEYVNASRWREIIETERGELQLALQMEDPCTTMADVRFFEDFKYV